MLVKPGTLAITVVNPGQTSAVLTLSLTVSAVLPVVADHGVLNAASLLPGAVAAGELIVIRGNYLGPTDSVTAPGDNGQYPTTLGGTRVWFDNTTAALLTAAAGQVIAFVPFELSGQRSTQMRVEFNSQKSTAVALNVAASAPGLFTADGSGLGQANVIDEDGSPNDQDSPAPGGTVVTLLATGGGQTNPAGVDGSILGSVVPQLTLPVLVQMGGETCANVTAAPAAGLVSGIVQISAQVPSDLSGTVDVVVTIGGNPSQSGVTLEVLPSDAMPVASRPVPLRRPLR